MSEHELWNELGNLYFMSGAYNQAVYAYHRSIQLDGSFGRPYSNLALTYVQQGKYEEAIELYRSSIELLADNKEKAISWSRLGNVYRHLKDYTKAVVAYQQADELDPQSTAEHLSQSPADILPKTTEDPTPQSVDEVPQETEAPSQPEEIITAEEESVQMTDDAPEPALIEENAVPSLESASDLDPLYENGDTDSNTDKEEEVDLLSSSSLTPTIILPSEEEIWSGLSNEPDLILNEANPIREDADSEIVPQEEEQMESPLNLSQPEEIALPTDEELWAELRNAVISTPSEASPISDISNSECSSLKEELLASPLIASLPGAIPLPSDHELWPVAQTEPDQIALDDSTASWALADLQRYQEDISESPETGALTIWGEPDANDEDWDLYPALDPEPDIDLPDADGDGLTRWIPIPEVEPGSELRVPDQAEEAQEEKPELEVYPSSFYQVDETANNSLNSSDSLPEMATEASSQCSKNDPVLISMSFPLALPSVSSAYKAEEYSEPTVQLLEVEVEERPAPINPPPFMPEFVLVDEPQTQVVELQADNEPVQPAVIKTEREAQELQEIEAGIAKFKRAVQTNPRNAYAWDALGTLYKSAGLYQDAIQAFQQATSIKPPKALYFHNLGLVYACEGRDEDAIAAFQRVIEIDPDYSLAHATLGGYYRKMGQEELAQKHIGKAMKNIFDSENEYNRACLEAICGNKDHAIELLGVALRNKQTYVDWILRDPDLDFIRQDPRFKQLVSDYTR